MFNALTNTAIRLIAIVVLIFIGHQPLHANDKQIERLAKPILNAIESGKTSRLASTAFSESSVGKYFSDADLSSFNSQLKSILEGVGKYNSSTIYFESRIQNTWLSRWYLLKYDRQPILLLISFYRASEDWQIQKVSLDTNLPDYIEDAAIASMGYLPSGLSNGVVNVGLKLTPFHWFASE